MASVMRGWAMERTGLPLTVTLSRPGVIFWPGVARSPLIQTSPSAISVSAARREQEFLHAHELRIGHLRFSWGEISRRSKLPCHVLQVLTVRDGFVCPPLMSSFITAEASTFNKDNPFPALITANRLLSKPGSLKETRHFVVSLAGSGLHYKAGDSLGVYPMNHPGDVDAILQCLDAVGDEPVSPTLLKLHEPIPLREALHMRLALNGPTSRILNTLHAKVVAPAEKAKLAELLAPEAKDQLGLYLEEREYVDILAEFSSAKLTPQEFVDHLRKLMPRLYSIASSPREYPDEIHLTVAVVRYELNQRRRFGVCTTFMADRAPVGEAPVPVFVSHSHFAPPEDLSKDVIMVGPGPGIAPFRAFVQDQQRAGDFLYEEEWDESLVNGRLTRLDTAWSRDQEIKVYVQDKMRENAPELWAWLREGAYFYVCGDAKAMAKDVDAALHDVIALQGGMTPELAAEYVKQMKKDKRYQRDVY
jgi:sulfite reductase (NADPH) flavoprotein alpha-component